MLWFKGWMEIRARLVLLVLAIALPYGLLAMRLGGSMPADRAAQIYALANYLLWPGFAVLFAGAGINTLTSSGMANRIHPSMYFTLSLPATRARLLAVRAAVGVGGYGALLTSVIVSVWALAPALRAQVAFATLLIYLFNAIAGALVAYSAAVLLATVLSETFTMYAGFGVLLPIWQLQSRVAWLAPAPFGQVNWAQLAFVAVASAILLFAAVQIAERRQY